MKRHIFLICIILAAFLCLTVSSSAQKMDCIVNGPVRPNALVESVIFTPSPEDIAAGPEDAVMKIVLYIGTQSFDMAGEIIKFQSAHPEETRLVIRFCPENSDLLRLEGYAFAAAGRQGKAFALLEQHIFADRDYVIHDANDMEEMFDNLISMIQNSGSGTFDREQWNKDYKNNELRAQVNGARQAAYDTGLVSGFPTVFINGAKYNGDPGRETLEKLLTALKAQDLVYNECPDQLVETGKNLHALLFTDKGWIDIELFPDAAPLAVNSFVFLAQNGWYDKNPFYQNGEDGFVLQSGDPTGTGYLNAGYDYIFENSGISIDQPGIVGMVQNSKGLNNNRFFISFDLDAYFRGQFRSLSRQVAASYGNADAYVKKQLANVAAGNTIFGKVTAKTLPAALSLTAGDVILSVTIADHELTESELANPEAECAACGGNWLDGRCRMPEDAINAAESSEGSDASVSEEGAVSAENGARLNDSSDEDSAAINLGIAGLSVSPADTDGQEDQTDDSVPAPTAEPEDESDQSDGIRLTVSTNAVNVGGTVTISVSAPGADQIHLYRNGKLRKQVEGDSLDYSVTYDKLPSKPEETFYAEAFFDGFVLQSNEESVHFTDAPVNTVHESTPKESTPAASVIQLNRVGNTDGSPSDVLYVKCPEQAGSGETFRFEIQPLANPDNYYIVVFGPSRKIIFEQNIDSAGVYEFGPLPDGKNIVIFEGGPHKEHFLPVVVTAGDPPAGEIYLWKENFKGDGYTAEDYLMKIRDCDKAGKYWNGRSCEVYMKETCELDGKLWIMFRMEDNLYFTDCKTPAELEKSKNDNIGYCLKWCSYSGGSGRISFSTAQQNTSNMLPGTCYCR